MALVTPYYLGILLTYKFTPTRLFFKENKQITLESHLKPTDYNLSWKFFTLFEYMAHCQMSFKLRSYKSGRKKQFILYLCYGIRVCKKIRLFDQEEITF